MSSKKREMAKSTATAGHSAHPPSLEKAHYTHASSRASSLANPPKQKGQASESLPTLTKPKNTYEPKEERQDGEPIAICEDILLVVANRLDEILGRCKNLEDYKRNISSLSKYARKAANSN